MNNNSLNSNSSFISNNFFLIDRFFQLTNTFYNYFLSLKKINLIKCHIYSFIKIWIMKLFINFLQVLFITCIISYTIHFLNKNIMSYLFIKNLAYTALNLFKIKAFFYSINKLINIILFFCLFCIKFLYFLQINIFNFVDCHCYILL